MNQEKSPVRKLAWDYYKGVITDRDLYRRERGRLIDEMLGEKSSSPRPNPATRQAPAEPAPGLGDRRQAWAKWPLVLVVLVLLAGAASFLLRPGETDNQEQTTRVVSSSKLESDLESAASPLLADGWSESAAAVFLSALTKASQAEKDQANQERWHRQLKQLLRTRIADDDALVIAGGFPSAREVLLLTELGKELGIDVPDWKAPAAEQSLAPDVPRIEEMDMTFLGDEEPQPAADETPVEEEQAATALPDALPIGEPPPATSTDEATSKTDEARQASPPGSDAQKPAHGQGNLSDAKLKESSVKPVASDQVEKSAPPSPLATPVSATQPAPTKYTCVASKANTRKPLCRDSIAPNRGGPRMRVLQPGTYTMGSDANPVEQPIQQVTIGYVFALSIYEITHGEYSYFCRSTGRACPAGPWTQDSPVVDVSWKDAVAYTEWLAKQTGKGYRLPSEAEWEYAARANTTSTYPSGDELLITRARFSSPSQPVDSPVAITHRQINPNGFQLYHMVGNVSEWVADVWSDHLAKDVATGRPNLAGDQGLHVIRGGSYADGAAKLRSAAREKLATDAKNRQTGFRVALDFQ